MALDFGTVVYINNLIALKCFTTFLINYSLHEKPKFWEKFLIKRAQGWIEREAIKTFHELIKVVGDVNLNLNDAHTNFFTVLYLSKHPEMFSSLTDGKELFYLMATTELEFELLKKPRKETTHG